MNREITPTTIAPPAAKYAHAVLVDQPGQVLHMSGVVPVRPDGSVPDETADQADVVWTNIIAVLAEAGMTVEDIASVTTYVVVDQLGSLGAVMAARDGALAGHRAASTLVTVPALAQAAWQMEVAIVAAK